MALFGANTVQWNDQPLHGITGLLLSPVVGVSLIAFFTLFFGTACVFGLWLFSKFKPLSVWAKDVVHYSSEGA
jgi:dolichyl-phosphate-mannose--protein O-mannosyl transferase